MNRCIVTGVETDNKWRGFVICKEAVEMAKEMETDHPRASMRRRMQMLQKMWIDDGKEAMESVAVENGETDD